jgi:RNA polymerase sigma factor (sigma-70 family)
MPSKGLQTVVQYLRSLTAGGLSDRDLLRLYIDDTDEAAFAALVRRHGRVVLGMCRRVLGAGADCDDAFQAAFVVLARKARSIRKQASLASWLTGVAYRVAMRLASQRSRRRRREKPAEDRLAEIAENQSMHSETSERAGLGDLGHIVDRELQGLPASYRDALVMCCMQELSHTVAAKQLGIPLGTLKGRVQRGRELLRKRLERRGVSCSAVALSVILSEQARVLVPPALARAAIESATHNTVSATVAALSSYVIRSLAAGTVKLSIMAMATVGLLSVAAVGWTVGNSQFDVAEHGAVGPKMPAKIQIRQPIPSKDTIAVSTSMTAQTDGQNPKDGASQLTADQVQRQAAAVYDKASRALLRYDAHEGESALIVTASGYVLHHSAAGGGEKSFWLSDGRRVTATLLGWSEEWGIGLAKLKDPGPWPHVELADSAGVRGGQCVVSLGFADTERKERFGHPLLSVDEAFISAVGRWFVVRDSETAYWRGAPFVFDLEGRLVGLGWHRWLHGPFGTVYTDVKIVRTLWNDLAANKNLDELRLGGGAPADKGTPQTKKAVTREVEDKAKAASVRIRKDPKDRGFSGTIVSADGLIATCGHGFHGVMPGAKVTVCLPDRGDVAGELVGYNPVSDIGLVRITDKGTWPHVEMGDSTRLRPGDACLFAGYGPREDSDRLPDMRGTTVAARSSAHFRPWLELDSKNTPFVGGDSGGGTFDAEGRLVAIHIGGTGGKNNSHMSKPIELLKKHWDELREPYEQSSTSPLEAAKAGFRQGAASAQASVVDVLDDKKLIARGVVVSKDGKILTLANLLPRAPMCRLPDGRVLPAKVLKLAREHNLALLKIEATGLTPLDWSEADNPPVGMLVSAIADAGKTPIGFMSHPAVSIPAEQGHLWAELEDTKLGLQVAKVFEAHPAVSPLHMPFEKGDIVVSIEGRPIPNRETYLSVWREKSPTAGDPVHVVVTRQSKNIEIEYLCGHRNWPRPDGQSPRCSGFDAVYSVAVDSELPLGAPVLDRAGKALGIAISWRARGWLLVIPAKAAKDVAGSP